MEKYQELREKARKNVQVADHMLTMSYPMLKDPKILVSVSTNLLQATDNAITAVLEYERLFKRIPPYHETLQGKLDVFRDKVLKNYGFDSKILRLTSDLKEIIGAHKESPVEFARKDKYVIASDNYELRTLTPSELKRNIEEIKKFIDQVYRVTQKNDGIFR